MVRGQRISPIAGLIGPLGLDVWIGSFENCACCIVIHRTKGGWEGEDEDRLKCKYQGVDQRGFQRLMLGLVIPFCI